MFVIIDWLARGEQQLVYCLKWVLNTHITLSDVAGVDAKIMKLSSIHIATPQQPPCEQLCALQPSWPVAVCFPKVCTLISCHLCPPTIPPFNPQALDQCVETEEYGSQPVNGQFVHFHSVV